MKRITIILAAALMAIGAYAQPKLVGHRGSGYGVENTVEAFKKGVELGYHYLETDIKTTKDLRFVCTHDDDTKRLGGTKTIATSTLDELQSETLTQTRSGVKYTGRLCSLEEYMQVAKDGGIGCVIELKWATGINNNDCSNIPYLIQAIDAMDMRKDVIILTSMKPCLEYIRKNYPDITLQFLTGQYWASHFDWCVQWGIDVDIQAGYFDKSTVKKYHEKGLKVNMWTTNDEAGYKTYGNMGCDFITTDRLDGHNLPDLDTSITFPPNTTDYPETGDVTVSGSYPLTDGALCALPSELGNITVKKAAKLPEGWAVLAVDTENAPSLFFYDGASTVKPISLEGIDGGKAPLYNIAATADGKLVGCNLANVTNDPETTGTFKTYIWDSPEAAPRPLWETSDFAQTGNWISCLAGESFTVSGRENDLKTYFGTHSTSGTTYRLCAIESNGSEIKTAVYALNNDAYNANTWGSEYELTVSPFSRNNIVVTSPSMTPAEYTVEWGGTRLPMTDYDAIPMSTRGISYFRYGEKVYAILPAIGEDKELTARVYDVTDGYASMLHVSDNINVGTLYSENATVTSAAIVAADGSVAISIFAHGLGAYNVTLNKAKAPEKPEDLELTLTRLWIQSNTTDNHPGDIDGTNAQQGTAVDGLFYINNCVEKLIHVFDQTGHIGTIPGGSGWGCARDDAGNIIVRDDKLAGTTHNFIIYPAGARPDNYGTPVTLEVTVPLEGQTNFINASGDVLGNGGVIYLYPNKQVQINIITVADGEVTGTRVSKDLQFAGSTAGYVIPVDNDTEHWLYTVRANGIVEYTGGVNSDISTSRASTTAPARNSTCGGAFIAEGGNRILIHNSGANYKGGFTVRDLTMDKVIANVDPIGALGYEAGGNYSTANWIIVERKGKTDYILYQYCPANGIAVYSLSGKYSGISSIATGNTTTFSAQMLNGEIVASEAGVALFDLAGKQIASTTGKRLPVSGLTAGIYVVRSNSGKATKVAVR